MVKHLWKQLSIKVHLLTAISYLIPFVVASGFMLAIGNIFGGTTMDTWPATPRFWDVWSSLGAIGLGLLPMVVATGISFSIASKPGIAPGIITGMCAQAISAGFLGGIIGGFIAGWIALVVVRYLKVPSWAEGLKPVLIVPFLAAVSSGLIMSYVIGTPVGIAMRWLTHYINGLDTGSALFYGILIGILSGVDYGGAINKTVYAILLTLQASGINEPMAVLFVASMVTPLGFTFAHWIGKVVRKPIFTQREVETLKTAFPMGLLMITEGTLPIILNDLFRSIVSTAVGGAVGGALIMLWGVATPVPHGGLLATPVMTHPLLFLAALGSGSLATAVVILLLKKRVVQGQVREEVEQSLKDDELSFVNL